jgi:hypothetical protein
LKKIIIKMLLLMKKIKNKKKIKFLRCLVILMQYVS